MKRSLVSVLMSFLLISMLTISCAKAPPKIVVATSGTYPPFSFVDKQGQLAGFDIDLMNAIAAKEDLKTSGVVVDFTLLLEGVAQGIYDVAIAAISITEERQKDMLFSDPYFTMAHVVTVRQDNTAITGLDSLTNKVVAVETGSTSAAIVSQLPGVIVRNYADLTAGWDGLQIGIIDAVVSDNTIASYYVSKYPDQLKIVGEPFSPENYGIAVAKNKPELLEKINAGLNAVKNEGLIEQLTQKWLPQ